MSLDPTAIAWLEQQIEGRVRSVEAVQTLWSGYGQIVRARLDAADVASVIVKWVEPPETAEHPRGWSGASGHARKLRSYEVERCFYTRHCQEPSPSHRTARCFVAERSDRGWRFVLEDLDGLGYSGRAVREVDPDRIDQCLAWLAAFHARFLGHDPVGLWEVGTYWHLGTRQEELAALEDAQLRDAAPRLDAALNSCRFRTLVHGDAKIANFCFGQHDVAAVDFQYVGAGCGIKDVAYFLSSCMSDAECEREAESKLDRYFGLLRAALPASVDAHALEDEWRGLYPAAWADFHRFLAGWAPDHWKIHRYTRAMTDEALRRF